MGKILSKNAVRIAAFLAIFLSFGVASCGSGTILSAPKTAEEWFDKGNAAFINRDYGEAIKCYKKTINLNPNHVGAYGNLGLAYRYGKQDYEKAIKYFDKAIEYFEKEVELNPDFARAYIDLGLAYQVGREDYEKAIKCYEKAIELNPNYVEAYYNLGAAYQEQGNLKKTIEYLIKAAKLGHEDARQWLRERNIPW